MRAPRNFPFLLKVYIIAGSVIVVSFAIPKWVLYACMPVGGAVMVVYSIRNIVQEFFLLAGRQAGRKGIENP